MIPTLIILRQYAPLCLSLFFSACIVLALAQDLTQWRQVWQVTHHAITIAKPTHTPPPIPPALSAIPQAHLFGQALDQGPTPLPIAQLNWQVVGLVKVNHEQGGSVSKAYLSIDGGPSHIYQKGDRLQGDIVIHEITPQAIIIEHQGHLEQLPLHAEKIQGSPNLPPLRHGT